MEDIKKAFSLYLKSTILKPKNWDLLGLGEFPPSFTSTKKFCENIVMTNHEPNKIEAIYSFFNYSDENGKFGEWIADSNKTKAIENFFRRPDYVPIKGTLEFIASLFDAPIQTIHDYQTSLVNNPVVVEVKPKSETPSIQENTVSKKSTSSRIRFYASIILLPIIAYFFFSYTNLKKENTENASIINELKFKPTEIHHTKLVSTSSNNDISNVSTSAATKKIAYHTNNIYNSDFLVPEDKWSFEVDSKGEDINSEYGRPFSEEIKPLHPDTIKNKTSISNEQMLIRLSITNNTASKWIIDNIYLKKINIYTPDLINIYQNTWSVKGSELSYQFELNKYASIYPITTFMELASGESQYFSMNVTGDHSCNGAIFRYKLVFSGNDNSGDRVTIESDKEYLIGFYKE